MKKISILILLLATCLGNALVAQTMYLNKTFVFDNNNYIHTIIPTDSGYILGGCFRNAIALIDSNANTRWVKRYYDLTGTWGSYTGSASPNALVNTGHSTYISCGTMQNAGPTANKVYSIKYSHTFDTLYFKLLLQEISINNYINNSFINSNGNYIFVGQSANSGLIIRTDSSGNFIDSTLILKGTYPSWFNTGIQMGNYYYLLGATRSYAPANVTDNWKRTDGWVVKTDILGNEIQSKALGSQDYQDSEFKFALLSGSKLITGGFYSYQESSGVTLSRPWLLVLNQDLSINKEIFLREAIILNDTLKALGIIQVIKGNKSSLIALCSNASFCLSTYEVQKKAMIVKFDSNFHINFVREYSNSTIKYHNPVLINNTEDGGFIFAGDVNDLSLSPIQQAWLVKTDSLGCDGLHSCNDTALVINVTQVPDTICKPDTTWIPVTFKGRSAPYSIYVNNTLVLDSVYYPYTLPLWIDTLVPYVPLNTGMQQIIIKIKDPWGWQQSDTIQTYVKNCGQGLASQEFYKHKIEIYPNPAVSEVHVHIRGVLSGEYTATLYDMQGKPIKQITTTQHEITIDISNFEQGVYTIRLTGNNINTGERMIKLTQ